MYTKPKYVLSFENSVDTDKMASGQDSHFFPQSLSLISWN